MGSRMAVNLANSQHQITIWNRSEVDKVFWKNRKVDLASSIQEAVSDADVVISMLSTPEAVSQVGLSNGGILDSLSEGKIWMSMRILIKWINIKKRNTQDTSVLYDKPRYHGRV